MGTVGKVAIGAALLWLFLRRKSGDPRDVNGAAPKSPPRPAAGDSAGDFWGETRARPPATDPTELSTPMPSLDDALDVLNRDDPRNAFSGGGGASGGAGAERD